MGLGFRQTQRLDLELLLAGSRLRGGGFAKLRPPHDVPTGFSS